jgi:calpain-15
MLAWTGWGEKNVGGWSVQFKRATDAYATGQLWGNNGISPQDVRQGTLGDCWFLASASAVAEHPKRIENMFLNTSNELSQSGAYGVNMYSLGVPHTVIVDDTLVFNSRGDPLYNKPSKDNGIWPLIYEKAFAKLHGNFAHIEGGDTRMGVKYLNGSPYEQYQVMYDKLNPSKVLVSADKLWDKLEGADARGDIITTGTPATADGTDKHQDHNNLYQSHAYTIIGVATLSDGTKIVKVRNPHAKDAYTGPWNDNDPRWNIGDNAQKAGFVKNRDDGMIYFDLGTFMTSFDQVNISHDTTQMYQSYFMKLNDMSYSTAKNSGYCGP